MIEYEQIKLEKKLGEIMLYFCATPIGNLEDITLRVIRILGEVDLIYAEDTRHTLHLLNRLNINKTVLSCHEHNEQKRADEIVALANEGRNIAIVSDAGMPGISDPGGIVLRKAAEAGVDYTVLPGACAAVTALLLSAAPVDRFVFEGFLPRENAKRNERINKLKREDRTVILYESPKRVPQTLRILHESLGERRAAVCRELTKMYEECARGTLRELCERYAEPPRGECVIVLEGIEQAPDFDRDELLKAIDELVNAGVKKKTAAKLIAAQFGASANELYNEYLAKQTQ